VTHVEFLSADGAIGIAHRGGAGEADANSEPAIALTARLGLYLETDVSVSADGVAVLLHPAGGARLHPGRTLTATAAELPAGVPRLEDVLRRHADLRVLVDVKQWPAVTPAALAIARAGAERRVSVGTFSQARTNAAALAIHQLTGTRVPTALGPANVARLLAGRRPSGDHALAQVERRMATRRLIATAHAAGIKVLVWTVNDRAEMERLLEKGVDGIMTDRPTVLRTLLAAR
jgi:glycerophosphoryl diester phosphodiesterase